MGLNIEVFLVYGLIIAIIVYLYFERKNTIPPLVSQNITVGLTNNLALTSAIIPFNQILGGNMRLEGGYVVLDVGTFLITLSVRASFPSRSAIATFKLAIGDTVISEAYGVTAVHDIADTYRDSGNTCISIIYKNSIVNTKLGVRASGGAGYGSLTLIAAGTLLTVLRV